jgi:coenzyme F420 hydrogenase subunit beta
MEKRGFKDLVDQIISKNLCVGCGTCVGVCPNTVLSIRETTAGFFVPVIQESKTCVSCGICFENCPARYMPFTLHTDQSGRLVTDETSRLLGVSGGAYIAHGESKETRAKGSSGGIVSALLIYALQAGLIDGAITVGMSEEKPWKTEIRIAKTKKEILEAAGSKYSIVPLNSIFQQVRKIDGRIALVGLPCHIRGLRMVQEHQIEAISKKIAFTIGLFCGLNFRSIATTFLLRKMNVSNVAEIEKLEYRHGYPGGFFVKLAEKELYDTKAGALLSLFRAQPCTLCDDLTNEMADLSVGDIYSMRSKEPIGVVLARTRKGEELLLGAKSQGQLDLCRVKEEVVIKSQWTGLLYKKKGSLVRKHILNGKPRTPSFPRKCTSKSFPTSNQMMFELLQQEVFFGRLNRSSVIVFEHLPSWLASFAYEKLLTFMSLMGNFVYSQP